MPFMKPMKTGTGYFTALATFLRYWVIKKSTYPVMHRKLFSRMDFIFFIKFMKFK
jgi:hypothetical protein